MRKLILFILCFHLHAADHFVEVPVKFTTRVQLPIIEAEIQGIPLKLVIDSGASCDLMLRKEILDKIERKRGAGHAKYLDVKGTLRHSPLYRLPSLMIQELEIHNVLALEEDPEFVTKGSIVKRSSAVAKETMTMADGRIGLGLLGRYNILFQFPDSFILEVEGKMPALEESISADFERSECGIILTADTDLGPFRFLLDTGANLSFLNASYVDEAMAQSWIGGLSHFKSRKFEIGGVQIGSKRFILLDLPDKIGRHIDGILGEDFFKKHRIYIDQENQKIFIE
ncbi:MAG: aspartyl protease family protein [Verrucomicrobia bacterium]|nr:aspartyl protease family protein [Verrucomicrobiota bacterium]